MDRKRLDQRHCFQRINNVAASGRHWQTFCLEGRSTLEESLTEFGIMAFKHRIKSHFWMGAIMALAMGTSLPSAHSDEGMWLFNRPPAKLLKEKYGFDVTK